MTTSAIETRTAGSSSRIFLIATAAVAGLLALAAIAGGAALLRLHRDGAGFYTTGTSALSTSTPAFVSDGLDVGSDGPEWLFHKGRLGTIRVTATGTAAKPVFVGIAHDKDVRSYLRGVAHDEISDFDVDPFSVTSVRRPGAAAVARPTREAFWNRSTAGAGARTLTWRVQKGSWDVVVMNADGSAGVRTDVSVGAKVPFVRWLGAGLLVAAAVLLASAAAAALAAWRRSHRSTTGRGARAGV
jgi:hypothetical protein